MNSAIIGINIWWISSTWIYLRYNLTTYYTISEWISRKCVSSAWMITFYVTQFFHQTLQRRFNNLYTLCLQKKIGISNKFYGVCLCLSSINPILCKKSLNCIGHIVYKNNTRQRLVSLFKLPSKLFIIFVFVWNSLWHVVMIKEGGCKIKEYFLRILWHSIRNLRF